jgi:hypothetical protein
MRLLELEAGTWFRAPHWSLNAVGELVAEPRVEHGLALIHVHCRQPKGPRASSWRSRLATSAEMERTDWQVCERPSWVVVGEVGGSG